MKHIATIYGNGMGCSSSMSSGSTTGGKWCFFRPLASKEGIR